MRDWTGTRVLVLLVANRRAPASPVRALASGIAAHVPASDETRVRADAERRLLQPQDDAEAGCAKDLLSFGRANRGPPRSRT
jgi:hypothetical protein